MERKIGLSIKAALDEIDTASLRSFQDTQDSDGGATLGDLMSAAVLRRENADDEQPSGDDSGTDGDGPSDDAADDEPADQ